LTCPASFFNYDCGAAEAQDTTCNTVGSGFCDAGNTPAGDKPGNAWSCGTGSGPCVCTVDYYRSTASPYCTEKRIDAQCTASGMTVTFAPHEGADFGTTYNGQVLQLDLSASDAEVSTCLFQDHSSLMFENSAGTEVPVQALENLAYLADTTVTSGNCIMPTAAVAGTVTTYAWAFLVKFGSAALSGQNVRIDVSCTVDSGTPVGAAVVSTSGVTFTYTPETLTQTIDHGLTWRIADPTDLTTAIGTPIAINTEVSLVIDLNTLSGVTDMGLYTVKLSNAPFDLPDGALTNSADLVEVTLYENGCPLRSAGRTLLGTTKTLDAGNNKVTIAVKFSAFVILTQAAPYDTATNAGSYPVGTNWINIEVGLCAPGTTCLRPIATGSATDTCSDLDATNYFVDDAFVDTLLTVAARRKRRQVSQDFPSFVNSSMPIVFFTPIPPVTMYHDRAVTPSNDCHQSLAFLIPIVLLAVLLVVAMGMAVMFCMKLSRVQNGHPEGNLNMAYKS